MVLGKSLRLYTGKENGKGFFLLENRSVQNSGALFFQSGAVVNLNAQDEAKCLKSHCKTLIDGYACLGVFKTTSSDGSDLYFLVLVTGCISIGKILDTEIFRITDTGFISLRGAPQDGERIVEVRRIINSGTFYFSWSLKNTPIDITLCAQRFMRTNDTDNRFFWNRSLFEFFTRYQIDCSSWLTKIMCGSISISTVYAGAKQAKACLFSRLSCERAGTRFNVRGVNDDGHVANFVETEQVIYLDHQTLTSYVMVRGSVPLFWEQPGVNVGSHKIKMSRGSEVSQPAYDRHVALLKNRYGKQHFINLCGSKEGEANLTRLYEVHHKSCRIATDIPLTAFDYHSHCSRGRTDNLKFKLREQIETNLSSFSYFTLSASRVISKQNGTFRVNCIDCLDRTNCVQTYIGLEVLDMQLQSLDLIEKIPNIAVKFQDTFRSMWIQNGDQVSRIYAGTGALEGKSKLKDSTLSVARTIQNNLLDSGKQRAFDILLTGSDSSRDWYDRARALFPTVMLNLPSNVLQEMCNRQSEFTQPLKVKCCIATWNVNGGIHFTSMAFKKSDQPLSDWLLDHHKSKHVPNIMDLSLDASFEEERKHLDIFAIGFQEIVDLNATNIVAASTSNQREWLIELQKTISRDTPYVLVTSVQLVGVCLFLFVRPEHATRLRDVAVDQVKTGLGGATGNKGGVSIRFRFYSSTIAFVCAHFAAGQHQITERNADYTEISKKIRFSFNRPLNSHEYVFWCGDFNYRIDLDNDHCKDLVAKGDLINLMQAEQLTIQRKEGKVFDGYVEDEITFPPTYKYDMNSDDYDTSEKCRVPAYTDRVLFRRNLPNREAFPDTQDYGKILYYGRAELKSSDHRPVSAVIEIECHTVIEDKRNEILNETLQHLGPPDATVILKSNDNLSNIHHDLLVSFLQSLERECGHIRIARQSEGQFKVIFDTGLAALKAAALREITLDDTRIQIEISSTNWVDEILQQINLIDNTIPLADEIEIDPLELEVNTSLGPQVDPSLLFAEEDDNDTHSGRSTPGIVETDEHKICPSRPPPPTKGPERPPPPPASSVFVKPSRPAPPPPSSNKLQKQAALNPPTITKTAPSTDSEAGGSFDGHSETAASSAATVASSPQPPLPPPPPLPAKSPSPPAVPAPPPPVPSAPMPKSIPSTVVDPFSAVNNEWNDTVVTTSVECKSHESVTSSLSESDEDGDEEDTNQSSLPPSSLPPCPPPPIPEKPPPPPPIPSRGRVTPSIPPRKQ